MKAVAALTLSLACIAGCAVERTYMDPNVQFNEWEGGGGSGYSGEGSDLQMQNIAIRGDIGPIRGFDGPANGYAYEDFGTSSITMDTQGSNGTGLVMIYLDRPISQLPVGETRFQGSNSDMAGNYVQLCSDSPDASIHFDGIAEDVLVRITDAGGTRNVDVSATISEGFDGGSFQPTVVNSSFNIQR